MTKRTTMLSVLLFLIAGFALAQTEERVFYIDFGQYNVANQGYLTNTDTNVTIFLANFFRSSCSK